MDQLKEITVEIMDVCNLACRHCNLTAKKQRKGFLSAEAFQTMMQRISGVLAPLLQVNFLTVEALLHPQLFELYDIVRAYTNSYSTVINTNGMLLTAQNIQKLLQYGVDEVCVSLDGCTKETVESFKLGADFDQIIKNVRLLVQMGQGMRIEAIFVSHRGNIRELLEYVDFCAELGIRRIKIVGLMANSLEMCGQCLYQENGLPEIDALYAQAKERGAQLGVKVKTRGTAYRRQGCNLGSSLYITMDGDVTPCVWKQEPTHFYLPESSCTSEKTIWGNIFEKDILEIWQSPGCSAFRKQLNSMQLPEACACCANGLSVMC